jgi:hypothetical protein
LAGPHDKAVDRLPEFVELLLDALHRFSRRRVN